MFAALSACSDSGDDNIEPEGTTVPEAEVELEGSEQEADEMVECQSLKSFTSKVSRIEAIQIDSIFPTGDTQYDRNASDYLKMLEDTGKIISQESRTLSSSGCEQTDYELKSSGVFGEVSVRRLSLIHI